MGKLTLTCIFPQVSNIELKKISNYIVYWKNALKYLRIVILSFAINLPKTFDLFYISYTCTLVRVAMGTANQRGLGDLSLPTPLLIKKKTFYEENSQFSLPS